MNEASVELETLEQVTDLKTPAWSGSGPAVSCVTLCHNENAILSQFLDHYRSLGVAAFYIVDDRSNDGSFEFLAHQEDVALFRPIGDAEFKHNLATWRQDILDQYLSGQWVTLPDVDEFLHYKDMPATLPDLANTLDRDGFGALVAIMLDMYAAKPLDEQTYSGKSPLIEEFPYFDGPGPPPNGYRISALPQSFAARFPTPPVCFNGGMRERLFFTSKPLNWLQRTVIGQFSNMSRPLNPTRIEALQFRLVRALTKRCFDDVPLVQNKFALLKWQCGMRFPRAPHSVSVRVRTSEKIAALLHFKFYKGLGGFEYNVSRGQHAGNAQAYSKVLENLDTLSHSPITEFTRRFDGLESLTGIIR